MKEFDIEQELEYTSDSSEEIDIKEFDIEILANINYELNKYVRENSINLLNVPTYKKTSLMDFI
jgi:hypothetical protein